MVLRLVTFTKPSCRIVVSLDSFILPLGSESYIFPLICIRKLIHDVAFWDPICRRDHWQSHPVNRDIVATHMNVKTAILSSMTVLVGAWRRGRQTLAL